MVQGEDLDAWMQAQRPGWDKLRAAQQWLLESVPGSRLTTIEEDEAADPCTTLVERITEGTVNRIEKSGSSSTGEPDANSFAR
ncbi:hypothetical protein [Streptomyces sp. AcE210]|uniref:hypothetical protein n=1 Tax=Streptomyces sp. AcE210 TaxID=2292703 RepID=UPI000E3081CB|nr:hypothetical protein [Streptomyces sp. AcE210]RFC78128.1 hypothetical protein DXZ75_10300 [Streptomyces sp. AcE210]